MSSELQQNRYDQIMRRVGGMIGTGSKVSEVLTELFPVVDLERVPGELLLLGGTRLCIGSAIVTGAAGERARIQVFNPADSGTLVTVSSVVISTLTIQNIRWATTETALTTGLATEAFRDRRLTLPGRPVGAIRTDSTVAATDVHGLARLLASTPYFLTDRNSVAVLPPGSGFEVGADTVATAVIATFYWRERTAEQSELSF